MTSTHDPTGDPTSDPTAELRDGLDRLAAQSRVRLAAVEELREQHRLIVDHSRRRLDASRRLLQQRRPSTPEAVLPEQPAAPAHQG